jgi:hypothetical protein
MKKSPSRVSTARTPWISLSLSTSRRAIASVMCFS